MRPNQILLNFEKQKKKRRFFLLIRKRFNSSTINQQRSVVKQSHRVSPNEKGAMRCKKKGLLFLFKNLPSIINIFHKADMYLWINDMIQYQGNKLLLIPFTSLKKHVTPLGWSLQGAISQLKEPLTDHTPNDWLNCNTSYQLIWPSVWTMPLLKKFMHEAISLW